MNTKPPAMDGAPWDWAAIHSRRGYLATLVAVVLLYVATAKFGLLLAFSTKQVTALWPPTGVAFAALILLGPRAWPAVFFGAFLANITTDESLLTAAGIAVGNTLGPAVAVSMARRFLSLDAKLERVRDAVGIGFFGAIGMLIPASSGVLQLALGGVVPWSAYGSVWWVWWVGDATGLFVVAPLILTWVARPHLHYSRAQLVEVLLLLSGLTLVGVIVMTDTLVHLGAAWPQKYLVFPFIVWAAVRFTPRETTTAIAIVASIALWGLLHDRGPFVRGNLDERLIFLQLFIAAVCLTGLSLSAAMAERRSAEDARRLSAERFSALVDASAQIVWSSSATGAVVESSPSWCAFTGQSEEQRAGWGWLDAIHPDDRGMVAALWHKAIDTRTTVATAYRIHHAGGAWRWTSMRAVPLLHARGDVREWMTMSADITARKEAELTVVRQADELRRSNVELQQFASVASHDLRAPLSAIAALAGWLEEDLKDALTDEAREQLRLLRSRVDRLQGLLADLLEYARAGREDVQAGPVDIHELLRQAIELSDVPDGFVVDVNCDTSSIHAAGLPLKRVFMNLIGNAIKHHDQPTGHIEISAREKTPELLEFVVADDGPGIPARYHQKVFQMFQRFDARHHADGHGMGLALVKKLVENAGGSIKLESSGRGSTFRFTWAKAARDAGHPE